MKKVIKVFLVSLMVFLSSCQAEDVAAYKASMKNPNNPVVKMETTQGDIYIELFRDEAPVSVKNFEAYVNNGFYANTLFHRVIKGFVIQGGGFEPGMKQKQTYPPIKNEAANGLKNTRGTLSMARTNVVDSATSQFFINLVDNRSLDHRGNRPATYGYAVFGEVIVGMDIVDAISDVQTTRVGYYSDVPQEDVIVTKAELIQK